MNRLNLRRCSHSVLLTILLTCSSHELTFAVNTIWTFDGDGNWTEAANWNNGVPIDDTFDVLIDDGDTAVTVTLVTSRTIGSLALGADDTLSIHNPGGGVQGLTSATGFANDGTIRLTASSNGQTTLTVSDGVLTNNATGLVHFQTGGFGTRSFAGDLINNGAVTVDRPTTFNKSDGSYTNSNQFTINGDGSLSIIGGGMFEQAAGTLGVTGSLTLMNSSVLNLTGGAFDLTGSLTRNSGTAVNLLTGGILNIDGNVNGSGTITQDGGTLNYTSGIIGTGTFVYLGGTITGVPVLTGTLSLGTAATNPLEFELQDTSTLVLANGSLAAGQMLTVRNTTNFTQGLTSATGFSNDGTILLTGTNIGQTTLTITDGTLTNNATGLVHFQTGGAAGRRFSGDLVNGGTVTVDRTTTFDNPGGSYTNSGQFTINSGGSLSITAGGAFTNQGELELGGTTFSAPSLDNSGIVRASSGGTASLSATTQTNTGIYEALDGSTLGVSGTLTNLSAGTLSGGTYRSVDSGGGAAVTIAGSAVDTLAADTTVELSGAGATMTFGGTALAASLMNNAGELRIFNGRHFNMAGVLANSGTVHLGGGGLADSMLTTDSLANTGTIAGYGTIHGDVVITAGVVAPGSSTGTLKVDGNYTQTIDGQLVIELGSSTQWDQLQVTGQASLAGTLTVEALAGFGFSNEAFLPIVTAGEVINEFTIEQLPTLPGYSFDVMYEADRVLLQIVGPPLAGDYNQNGAVDAADYTVWRDHLGTNFDMGGNGDETGASAGVVDEADYALWVANFGDTLSSGAGAGAAGASPFQAAAPEPASWLILSLAVIAMLATHGRNNEIQATGSQRFGTGFALDRKWG